MKAKIGYKTYDTDKAACIGSKYVGEFGQPEGFEEKLFITEAGRYFLYGTGGTGSPYAEPSIQLLTNTQANNWRQAFQPVKVSKPRRKPLKGSRTSKSSD